MFAARQVLVVKLAGGKPVSADLQPRDDIARGNRDTTQTDPDGTEEDYDRMHKELADKRATLPPGHFLIASSESILGEHLVLEHRYREAETLLLRSERSLVASRGEHAPIVGDARSRLVKLYEAWGKPGEAARWKGMLTPS